MRSGVVGDEGGSEGGARVVVRMTRCDVGDDACSGGVVKLMGLPLLPPLTPHLPPPLSVHTHAPHPRGL